VRGLGKESLDEEIRVAVSIEWKGILEGAIQKAPPLEKSTGDVTGFDFIRVGCHGPSAQMSTARLIVLSLMLFVRRKFPSVADILQDMTAPFLHFIHTCMVDRSVSSSRKGSGKNDAAVNPSFRTLVIPGRVNTVQHSTTRAPRFHPWAATSFVQ
jgi:hypothetical protein